MNQIFQPRGYFAVPDGTDVSPFLNATDVTQKDVPWGLLGKMSITGGRIGPKLHSWVHFHPVVTQVTYLLEGELTVRMKDAAAAQPYDLSLHPGNAVVTQAGTLFQLRNDGNAPAVVLYIVSPSYIFEVDDNGVRYDDAILVAKTWEELVALKYDLRALNISLYEAMTRREESMRRLAQRRGINQPPLAQETILFPVISTQEPSQI